MTPINMKWNYLFYSFKNELKDLANELTIDNPIKYMEEEHLIT